MAAISYLYFLYLSYETENRMGCSYIQSHRLLGPGLLHLVIHDGVVDSQSTKDHKRLVKMNKTKSTATFSNTLTGYGT